LGIYGIAAYGDSVFRFSGRVAKIFVFIAPLHAGSDSSYGANLTRGLVNRKSEEISRGFSRLGHK
jgi:hypothetical protein